MMNSRTQLRGRRPHALLAFIALVFSACASAGSPAAPVRQTPSPQPVEAPPPPRPAAAAAAPLLEAPANWHQLDETADRVPGISAERAYREVLSNRRPARTIVVAVIDGGVDTAHVDLRSSLWRNPAESPNGRDDDGNGYIDDVIGWNFIGGGTGENVHHDTFELTRLHAGCTGAPAAGVDTIPTTFRQQCDRIAQDFESKKSEVQQTLQQIRMIDAALTQALPILQQAVGSEELNVESVTALRSTRSDVQRARDLYLQLAANGITTQEIERAKEAFESQARYGLDPAFNPRPIVGDDYPNKGERAYGNRDVMGPDASHGTHVAGIIAGMRGNAETVDGGGRAVQVMAIRTVPDGDERDKDVANAIRYAVDNGAQIINMSFGKAYSPYKHVVDEAVRYADERGVLMVHAAGNDSKDLASEANYPSPVYESGGRARHWIEVGASSWKSGDELVAPFSNYGGAQVDVFAPGADILSATPGGGQERQSGTSMAAPVVSGLAAMLMAYYPDLTAADVRRIILESATKRGDQMVNRPGASGERVRFGNLSVTGGIVNAYAALRMAEEASQARR